MTMEKLTQEEGIMYPDKTALVKGTTENENPERLEMDGGDPMTKIDEKNGQEKVLIHPTRTDYTEMKTIIAMDIEPANLKGAGGSKIKRKEIPECINSNCLDEPNTLDLFPKDSKEKPAKSAIAEALVKNLELETKKTRQSPPPEKYLELDDEGL